MLTFSRLQIPRVKNDQECRPRPVIRGISIQKPKSDHPALLALTYFANRLQQLGYPFSWRDRNIYYAGMRAVGGKRTLICPNCGNQARFMPIDKHAKIKAWFCDCSYETHTNGLHRGD